MKSCDAYRDLLPLHAVDETSIEENLRLEQHLDRCAGCRAELEAYRERAKALDQTIRDKENHLRLEQQEWINQRERTQLEIENQRILLEEEKAQLENHRKKMEHDLSERLNEAQYRAAQKERAENERLVKIEKSLIEKQGQLEQEGKAQQERTLALEEVFGVGTAAVVSPVSSFGYKGEQVGVADGRTGALAQELFQKLTDIQYGLAPDTYGWLDFIE